MGTYTQAEVFREAAIYLQDGGFTRWTPPTLNTFLNAAIREVALNKPNTVERTKTLDLVAGIRQTLSEPDFALIRVYRNQGGRTVSEVSREIMDAMIPDWADGAIYPASTQVQHYIYDPAEPTAFLVFPANAGGGQLIAAVATEPDPIPNGQTPSDVSTYTNDIPLPSIYREALVNYIVAKAFTIDAEVPEAATRAQSHYAMFAQALGIKFKMESLASPKSTYAPNDGGA